jgi:hypothetical protein
MLLLFAVSITPKQLLHDAITGHKHNYKKFTGTPDFQTSKKGFQCNWNNDVIESPFTFRAEIQLEQPVFVYNLYFNLYTSGYHSTELFFNTFRGPPSQA